MRRSSSASNRAKELGIALRDGKKRNGNHLTRVTRGLLLPDAQLCAPCPSNFQCYLRGLQVSYEQAEEKRAPCVKPESRIEFSYHDTVCLTYDINLRRITDHGMWGYSKTTSQAISWYLDALWEHDYLQGGGNQVGFLKTCFKKLHDSKKLPALGDASDEADPGSRWVTGVLSDLEENTWFQL